MLPDVVEIGSLPSFVREGEGTVHAFYRLTRQGLSIECSSISKIQVLTYLFRINMKCHYRHLCGFEVQLLCSNIQYLVLYALDAVTVLRMHCQAWLEIFFFPWIALLTVIESERLSYNSFLSVVL